MKDFLNLIEKPVFYEFTIARKQERMTSEIFRKEWPRLCKEITEWMLANGCIQYDSRFSIDSDNVNFRVYARPYGKKSDLP